MRHAQAAGSVTPNPLLVKTVFPRTLSQASYRAVRREVAMLQQDALGPLDIVALK